MFGLTEKQMLGWGWLAAVDDAMHVAAKWRLAVQEDLPWKERYSVVVNGESREVKAMAIAVRLEDGTRTSYVGIVHWADQLVMI
jgi:hypothetical protein